MVCRWSEGSLWVAYVDGVGGSKLGGVGSRYLLCRELRWVFSLGVDFSLGSFGFCICCFYDF